MVLGFKPYEWVCLFLLMGVCTLMGTAIGRSVHPRSSIHTETPTDQSEPSTVLVRFHLGTGKCTEHTVYYNVDLGRYYVLDSEHRIVMLLGPLGKIDGFRDTWMPWSNTPKDLIELWKQGKNNE